MNNVLIGTQVPTFKFNFNFFKKKFSECLAQESQLGREKRKTDREQKPQKDRKDEKERKREEERGQRRGPKTLPIIPGKIIF